MLRRDIVTSVAATPLTGIAGQPEDQGRLATSPATQFLVHMRVVKGRSSARPNSVNRYRECLLWMVRPRLSRTYLPLPSLRTFNHTVTSSTKNAYGRYTACSQLDPPMRVLCEIKEPTLGAHDCTGPMPYFYHNRPPQPFHHEG